MRRSCSSRGALSLAALIVLSAATSGAHARYHGAVCHPSGLFSTDDYAIRPLRPCALWKTGTFDESTRAAPPAAWSPPCSDFDGTQFHAGVWAGGACSPAFPDAAALRGFLTGKRILFYGDSMIRHLFNRLFFYVRDQRTVVDPWYHSAAVYTFNATHDALSIGAIDALWVRVEAPTFEARFTWDPRFESWSSATAQGWSLVVAAPVYWREDNASDVLTQLASLSTVVMVTTPLTASPLDEVFSARNAWIEQHARHAPLARMAHTGVFLRDAEDGKHFQCQFVQAFSDLSEGNDGKFKSPASGDCRDIVNLNALMMLLPHAAAERSASEQHAAPTPLQPASAFAFGADGKLVDALGAATPLASPFMTHFSTCMADPVARSSQTATRYGPYPPQYRTGIVVTRRPHPVQCMADLALHEDGPGRKLPSVDDFTRVVQSFNRTAPIVMHCFKSDYGGPGRLAGHAGYYPMIQSWFSHVSRVGLAKHVLFVASNETECAAVSAWAPCLVNTRELGYPMEMQDWAQNFRWIYSNLLLRSGFDHISTDSDAFFLANPVPHLQAGRAVAGLSDTLYDGTFPMGFCNEPDSPCQSTGFTYFRATPAVRNMVREFSSSYGGGFEQAQWNPYAARLVRMGEFDALPRFGNFTFANWNVMKESIANQESFTVAVMHMGGEQRGVSPGSTFWMDIKEYLYRCLQLWLDDSNTEVMEEHA